MKKFLNRKKQCLVKNIVFLDGFSSSGKSLVGPIFGYLKRGEQWQVNTFFDKLAILHYQEKISLKSLSALINTAADELIYNLFIGRNVNFRSSDRSSPYYDGLEKKYIKRLKSKDKNTASKKIQSANPILPLAVHYIFGYSDLLLRVFKEKLGLYILILRDPIFLIKNWHEEKWTKRIGHEDRDYTLCIEYKNKTIPWYTKEYADDYIKANDIEKSILTIYQLFNRTIKMYKKTSPAQKKKIELIFYEDFINYPSIYIDKICKKLNTKKKNNFRYIMKKLSLPRKNKDYNSTIDDFLKEYEKNISPHIRNKLFKLNDLYLKFYYSKKLSKKNKVVIQ